MTVPEPSPTRTIGIGASARGTGMSDPGLEALLGYLERSRGFDSTGYERTSLERRFRRRMSAVGCESHGDYLDFLEVHPDEFEHLFDALLIDVTSFFRDPAAWEVLREQVLPGLLERRDDDAPIRVWSAGCASGQEAYSIAMALAELLGPEQYRERVKIYGTDVDEDALSYARAAVYTVNELEDVPEEMRDRYFERAGARYAFRSDLRRTVIFGRNDLLQDAPIARLDLLLCRNTLMYFTAETQARVLRHFHFALAPEGTLMLGRWETMLSQRESFEPVDLMQRIFRRAERMGRDAALEVKPGPQVIARSGVQDQLEADRRDLDLAHEALRSTIDELETANEALQTANEELATMNEALQSTNEELDSIHDELRDRTNELDQVNELLDTILTSLGLAVAVIDPGQRIQVWNRRAEDLWGLRQDEAIDRLLHSLDIGLPTAQLVPVLRAALSGGVRHDIELEAVNRRGHPIVCQTTVMPLVAPDGDGGDGRVRGAIVLMNDRPATDGDR